MKPAPFEYVKPETVSEALAALAAHPDAQVLAGGQSLVPMLNMRLVTPSHVVDIGGLPGLDQISVSDGRLRIGALVRHATVATSDAIAEAAPLLGEAARHIGHAAIRNRGTIGGSLALADPAAELPACMLALGGRMEIQGPAGTRQVEAADFFTGAYETALQPGELLGGVDIPVIAPGYRSAFAELARRHGDYALAGLAAHGRIEGGSAFDLRLAFFAAGDRPVLAAAAAKKLEGRHLDQEAIAEAAGAIGDDVDPIGQPGTGAATKAHHCTVLLGRVLARLAA